MKIYYSYLSLLIIFFSATGCSKNEDEVVDQNSIYFNEQAFPGQTGELKSFIVNSDTLYCEIINNKYVFQGDIILTSNQVSGKVSSKGIGLESIIKRWPNNTVYYWFGNTFPYKSRVRNAIKYWEKNTSVKFIESDNNFPRLWFVWDKAGCYSCLGMIESNYGDEHSIGIADWADEGTVIHEIGHGLGLVHEFSKANRDQFIKINKQNIVPGKENLIKKVHSQFISLQFDFNSIMLCSSFFLSENGLPTLTKTDGSTFDVQRKYMSQDDINTVKAMYSAPLIKEITTSNVTDKSASIHVTFEEFSSEKIMETGIFWGTSQNPENDGNKLILGNVADYYSTGLIGLDPNTIYYLKAYAVNSQGIFYGNPKILKTLTGVVKDIDGNEYWSVTIGTQIWLSENLKTTRLNNGDLIPNVTGNNEWATAKTMGYCWYNLEPSKYGALYNYYAVSTGKLCPTGWHVPSDKEWKVMEMYLGMSQAEVDAFASERGSHNEGGKLKEASPNFWNDSSGATNETGFSALPGGYRSPTFNATGLSQFYSIGREGYWWCTPSASESSQSNNRILTSYYSTIRRSAYNDKCGFSVRCVKD